MPDGVHRHLDACSSCRDRFRIADALLTASPPAVGVSPLVTERIVAAVRRDAARRRHIRWLAWSGTAGVGVAAAVAFMLAGRPNPPTEVVRVEPVVPPVAAAPPRLDEVGDAVVALSKRTVADVADQGRLLLPDVSIPATLPPFEVAGKPLDEARVGLSEGIEPVTTSAKRAFGLMLFGFGSGSGDRKN